MFGYIRPADHRLSQEEYERFRAAYCGLCHTLGKRYGFSARFLLNFDFTLLAILLSESETPKCSDCRCVVHPCKAHCTMEETDALDLAADRSMILFWWQLQDHIADHGLFGGIKYRALSLLYRRTYRRARDYAPDFDAQVQRHLSDLAEKERALCASIDEAAEPFAALMADIADCVEDATKRRILRQLFYHLGRWIYLIDAADDYEKDAKEDCYNPLRYRYAITGDKLPDEVKAQLGATLDQSIRQMAGAYALWDYGAWTPVLDSIFYESCYGIGNAVFEGTYHKPQRKDRLKTKKTEETV